MKRPKAVTRTVTVTPSDADTDADTDEKQTKTPDADLVALAASLHARHPSHNCGKSAIVKQLKTIVGKMAPEKRAATLLLIEENHTAWCLTPTWRTGFAKGLENWLAPSKLRWKDPPSAQDMNGAAPRYESPQERAIREAIS